MKAAPRCPTFSTWRVYVDSPHGFYFTVAAFRRLSDMRTGFRSCFRTSIGKAWGACHVNGYNRKARHRKSLGMIFLCRKYATVRVISHECVHAAIGWATRGDSQIDFAPTKKALANGDEERLCEAAGNLMSGVVAGLYKHGFLVIGSRSVVSCG